MTEAERNLKLSTLLLDLDRVAQAAADAYFSGNIGPLDGNSRKFWLDAVTRFAEDRLACGQEAPAAAFRRIAAAHTGPVSDRLRERWDRAAQVVLRALEVGLPE